MTGTLTPAWGRDYTSRKAVIEAFLSGKDFMFNPPNLNPAQLCSIHDYKSGETATLRYDRLTESTDCEVP